MGFIKLIFFLGCLSHPLLITDCQENLIFFGRDRESFKLFYTSLNGTRKPAEAYSPLNLLTLSITNIDSLQCIGNDTIFLTGNGDNFELSQLVQISNGMLTSNSTYEGQDTIIRQDWLSGNLYLVSEDKIMVVVPGRNSTLITKVIATSPNNINDLALNPNSGLMYFATDEKIMQASMDGSGVEELVSNGIRLVSLAIDLAEGDEKLYWADSIKGTIEYVKLDGSKRVSTLIKDRSNLYSSLNIFEDQLIYLENYSSLKSVNKHNGSEVWTWTVERIQDNFQHFTICDERNQPIRRRNPCDGLKCSYLCVVSAGAVEGFRCLCPTGKVLDVDRFTCTELKLAIAGANAIKIIGVDVIGKGEFETITIRELESIQAFCYNPEDNSLILYDTVLKKIFEYDLIKKEARVLVDTQVENVVDIDIDAVAQNLYWINPKRQTLEVMSLKTNARKILRFDLEENASQLIIPSVKYLGIVTSGNGWIRIYSRDGYSSASFADAGSKPIGLSYDLALETLFWIEGRRGIVSSTTTRLTLSKNVKMHLLGPVRNGIIHQGSVYWIPENVEELRFARVGSNNISKIELDGFGNGKVAILDRNMEHMNLDIGEHECSWKNEKRKNCSHICMPSGLDDFKGECVCPDGFELEVDGLACKRQKECVEMPTQFKCNDGACISGLLVCDGFKDCGESEDEVEGLCEKWKTGNNQAENDKLDSTAASSISDEKHFGRWLIPILILVIVIAFVTVGGGIAKYRKNV